MTVVVAVACHQDEPAVGRTVAELGDDIDGIEDARIVVCVNGPSPRTSTAAAQLAEIPGVQVRFLERPSKPAAWNVLRTEPADVTVFGDADIAVRPGSLPALVAALREHSEAVLAAAAQEPAPVDTAAGRVATIPFKLSWGGVAGTLYAARTSWLPQMPEDVILDDAWLWAHASSAGEHAIIRVPEAVATFRAPSTWRDLWHQRLRAEAGKRQLRSWGIKLAPAPTAARPSLTTLRTYSLRELPAVAALAGLKLAASTWSRIHPPQWGSTPSTKA